MSRAVPCFTLWLLALLAPLLAARAGAEDPAPPDAAKERLRAALLERFLALPVVNHRMEAVGIKPGEPESRMQVDIWREGDWASFDVRIEAAGEAPDSITLVTDGAVTAMENGGARAVRIGPGLERFRACDRVHDEALRALETCCGVVAKREAGSPHGVAFKLGVRRDKEDRRFSLQASMGVGGRGATPSWLDAELWRACTVAERTGDGTVALHEDGVELVLRAKDGLPLRWEAHDEAAGRHVRVTNAEPSASPKARRERVRALCEPLRPQAREPHPVALFIDAALRVDRVGALLRAPADAAAPPPPYEAWAAWLVDTEAKVFALDEWKPDALAAQREVVLKALLAALRELGPKVGASPDRAARLAAHLTTRWTTAWESNDAAPGERPAGR
jgi:hypothetical protein